MKKNAMRKNLLQSILKSFGRYVAIVAIIALGASMFVGLLMTKSDMVATGQKYMDEQNMFDLRLVSTYGWEQEQLAAISALEGVVDAEGVIYIDAIASTSDGQDDCVYRFYQIPERINKLSLRGGRMPESGDECLIDGYHMTDDILGTEVWISSGNEESTLETLVHETYTVVGYVASPLYMDMNRGTTSVGSGTLTNCLYLLPEGLDTDVYSEINITIPGDYDVYTKAYNDAMKAVSDELEPIVENLGQQRYQQLRHDALEEYREGRQEYLDGLNEYRMEKSKALDELHDAYQKLVDAEKEIADNEKKIADGEKQLARGWRELADAEQQLAEGWEQYEEMEAAVDTASVEALKALTARKDELQGKIDAIDAEIRVIDGKLAVFQDESNTAEINRTKEKIAAVEGSIAATERNIKEAEYALEQLRKVPETPPQVIAEAESIIAGYNNDLVALRNQKEELTVYLNSLEADREMSQEEKDLRAEKQDLLYERSVHAGDLKDVNDAIGVYDDALASVMAELKAAKRKLQEGEEEIRKGRNQLAWNEKKLKDGKKELEDAKVEVADGWIEYEDGKAEAEKEFAEAEEELAEGRQELEDGLIQITELADVDTFVLDRSSNIGYGSLDSASDIVQGVSRVFPAFFLLVAALVCITTMTRMIDEERTQIGTLKALGYSNGAIISKYMIYAGSGAVVGCGLGVFVGSMAFPTILWQAYKIMLYITDGIVLRFNLLLCTIVVSAYTAVMLFVTWYCCRKALQEVPAELIRPKAPDAGKKIFMERLPFWHRISFLNKVTIRNIFRYRQRLAMMMVGIGGCTALLLTGFGLRDSIVNVVDYQFEEVTTYDLQVYFTGNQSEGDRYKFEGELKGLAENVMFYHQESIEVETDDQIKEIYLMAGDHRIQEFIDFHKGEEKLSMPRVNEVMMSVGVCEALGIQVGDTVTMRNADMQRLELTVSGIYDNHVNNYAIILPETIEDQWGYTPDIQMALVKTAENKDTYSLSAVITDLDGVMNVAVSEDLADMVGGMMDALDLVVWVIVFCAGLLAAIVLYNLTNININERIREIATIKVLGFNASETAAYVFKENLSLSAIGSVVGLGLGYLLLIFVMDQIKIDMVWFKAMITPASYVWSIALTMLSACVVDFIFYFKLEKINMAEALKSVE